MPGPPFSASSGAVMGEKSASTLKNGAADSNNGLVDPQLWHACAGSQVHLPQVGSSVIYFPQGHAEHADSPPDFTVGFSSSTIACRVLSVKFLADRETDEVFARIRLQPEYPNTNPSSILHDTPSPPQFLNPTKVASFAKTLTQSDANNGGGFSVPRYCAETIFPRLDYSEDPPVQIVLAKDVHGRLWKFRHIYRGTPRRHLLTTGWSNFVNQKKLVAGDAIVFLRSASGELCVGVRRSTKGIGKGESSSSSWHHFSGVATAAAARPSSWDAKRSYNFLDNGTRLNRLISPGQDIAAAINSFARNRARVTAKSVLEAATLAASGQAFEVVYYPRATISEFCVKAHVIKVALQQSWAPGIRFKMAVETEDASRVSWFMGTVSKVQEADPILWPNSPWKILQVTWDEPDMLQGVTRVSPWQVELVSPVQLPPFSFPKKKVRLSQPSDLQLDGQGFMGLTMAAPASDMPGHIDSWHGYMGSVPAGMQGARHDRNYGLSIQSPKFQPTGLFLNNFYQQHGHADVGEGGSIVSTDLNTGDFFNQVCPGVQNNLSTTWTVGNTSYNHSTSNGFVRCDSGGTSGMKNATFVLFGQTIDASQSASFQQPQVSGGNSSDSARYETIPDVKKSEAYDKVHMFFPSQGKVLQAMEKPSLLLQQGGKINSTSNGVGTLKWCKEQASFLDRNVTADCGSNLCKIFSESDDVGRTVDLSSFGSYEELYERLKNMFGAKNYEFLNRVVSVDSMGSTRPVGNEPYRDFMRRVKRLKILSESSSEGTTKGSPNRSL